MGIDSIFFSKPDRIEFVVKIEFQFEEGEGLIRSGRKHADSKAWIPSPLFDSNNHHIDTITCTHNMQEEPIVNRSPTVFYGGFFCGSNKQRDQHDQSFRFITTLSNMMKTLHVYLS